MTVAELIEKLKKEDPKHRVVSGYHRNNRFSEGSVISVNLTTLQGGESVVRVLA